MARKADPAKVPVSDSINRAADLASLNALAKFCLDRKCDFTTVKHESLLIRMRSHLARVKRRRTSWRLFALPGGVLVAVLLLWFLSPLNFIPAVIRLSLIQILPYWDWTYLKEVPCLWKKPELSHEDVRSNSSSSDHCIVCEDLTRIYERRGGELNSLQVGEDFLVEELPLIIRNAFMVEPEGPSLRLEPVLNLHLEDDTLVPCRFRTNLRTKQAFQFHTFLRKVKRKDLQIPWFAIWEFCEHHHVKECRSIIPRPPELPTMLEIADSFWFFAASNFTAVKFKYVELSFSVFWYTQMSGSSTIRLEPKPACHSICRAIEAELRPGDALLMTTDLFDVSWMPGAGAEVLAIAAGAI